jgi:hypothetical protein
VVPLEEGEDHGEEGVPRARPKDEVLDATTTTIDPTLSPVPTLWPKRDIVVDCWYYFDGNFTADDKYAGAATSYSVDSNWYTDTGATDHVIGELEKLTIRDKYKGNDQVHTANGAGMNISHIGHSIIKLPHQNLMLKNVLYILEANKNLVSVYKLAYDNLAFLEYHPNYFVVKDRATKRHVLKGRCHKGLYPLPVESLKLAFGAFKPSLARWHS